MSLVKAVRDGDIDSVKQLISSSSIDEPDWDNGGTLPLLEAVSKGNHDIAKLLIDSGCDVNVTNSQGESALHAAVESRTFLPQMVELLLDAKCDANITDSISGYTPLHLITKQFSPNKKVDNGIMRSFSRLADKTDVNKLSKRRSSAVHRTSMLCDREEALNVLIDAGANVDIQNDEGETPLMIAVEKRHMKVVKRLVDSGSNAGKANRYGETALHMAARLNQEETAKILSKAAAPVNALDLDGNTPAHLAAGKGLKNIVEVLLENQSVDVNIPNHEGKTVLHVAVESGFPRIVEILLDHSACDLLLVTHQKETALDLALDSFRLRAHPEISQLITKHINLNTALKTEDIHITTL